MRSDAKRKIKNEDTLIGSCLHRYDVPLLNVSLDGRGLMERWLMGRWLMVVVIPYSLAFHFVILVFLIVPA